MGASVSIISNVIVRSSTNEVVQRSENICRATCTNEIDNLNVIVKDRSEVGDINITQRCESNAMCVMKTSLDSIALNQLSSDQSMDTSNPGKPFVISSQLAVNVVQESLRNVVTQTISNICDATSANAARNLTFYIGNESTVGDINLTQEGVVTSACEIDSLASSDNENISEIVQTQHQRARIIITICFFVAFLIGLFIFMYYRAVDKKTETALRMEAVKQIGTGNLTAEQTDSLLYAAGVKVDPSTIEPSPLDAMLAVGTAAAATALGVSSTDGNGTLSTSTTADVPDTSSGQQADSA